MITQNSRSKQSQRSSDATQVTEQSGDKTCSECGGQLQQNKSEVVCTDCGMVSDRDLLSTSVKNQDIEGTSRQIGSTTAGGRPASDLTTHIGSSSRDANGRTLSPKQRQRAGDLRKWQKRIHTQGNGEQVKADACRDIDRLISALDMPVRVSNVAKQIFRDAHDQSLLNGRTLEGFTAAAVYASARVNEIPLRLTAVKRRSRLTGTDTNKIDTAFRTLSGELGLELVPAEPSMFLTQFQSELELNNGHEYELRAEGLLDKLDETTHICGRKPTGLAVAALYAAVIERQPQVITQADCAAVADVAEETVRKRFDEIREVAKQHGDWDG